MLKDALRAEIIHFDEIIVTERKTFFAGTEPLARYTHACSVVACLLHQGKEKAEL